MRIRCNFVHSLGRARLAGTLGVCARALESLRSWRLSGVRRYQGHPCETHLSRLRGKMTPPTRSQRLITYFYRRTVIHVQPTLELV